MLGSSLDLTLQIELIKVRLHEPLLLDVQVVLLLQFLEICPHAAVGDTDIIGEPRLPWKAKIILPRVTEQHGVSELCTRRNFVASQDVIGYLGEAAR